MSSVDSEAQCGQGGAPGFREGTKVTAGGLQRLDSGGRWGRCIQEGKWGKGGGRANESRDEARRRRQALPSQRVRRSGCAELSRGP